MSTRYEQGLALQAELDGPGQTRRGVYGTLAEIVPDPPRLAIEFAYGDIHARPGPDDVAGRAKLRDLLTDDNAATAADVAREPLLLPDSLPVSDALRRFKAERQQFALAVDERGSIDCIVTLEDLLEEVAGEIYDETGRDVLAVARQSGGSVLLPGTFPAHDLPDLDVHLEERRRRLHHRRRARPDPARPRAHRSWRERHHRRPAPGHCGRRGARLHPDPPDPPPPATPAAGLSTRFRPSNLPDAKIVPIGSQAPCSRS